MKMNDILLAVGFILAVISVYFDPKGYCNGMGIGMMLVSLAHQLSANYQRIIDKKVIIK